MGVKCLVTAFAFKFVASNQNKIMKKSEAATQRCSQEKDVLKICSKITGEHSCRSVISIKLLCNFIEIALRYDCFFVNQLHIFRIPFLKNSCGFFQLFVQLVSLVLWICYSKEKILLQQLNQHRIKNREKYCSCEIDEKMVAIHLKDIIVKYADSQEAINTF